MVQPQASGFSQTAPPPRPRRSRAGGIMLAPLGVVTLVCVFVLPWGRGRERGVTLWEIYQSIAEPSPIVSYRPGEVLSYQVPFFTAVAAGVIALLAGGLAAALGLRVTNVLATLAGLFAAFLAIFSPVYFFFRGFDLDSLDFFISEYARVGFYAMFPISLLLLVATIVAFVGVFRAGRTPRPATPAYAPRPGGVQQGYAQPPYQQPPYQQPPYQQPPYQQPPYQQ